MRNLDGFLLWLEVHVRTLAPDPSQPASPPKQYCMNAPLEGVEERDQLCLLLLGQVHLEPLVVEVDGLHERGRRPVVEVRRARRESAQHWPLEPVDVAALST